MKPSTHYRSTSAEQLHACAACGLPQPSRTMLLSSRGAVCSVCSAESDAPRKTAGHQREAAFDAVLLSSFANLGGIGLVLSHSSVVSWSTMTVTWAGCFVTVALLASGLAISGLRRARALRRAAKGSIPALVAMGLAGSALAFCLAAAVLLVLG